MNKMFKILSLSLLMSVQLVNASSKRVSITQRGNNFIIWNNTDGTCIIEKSKSNIDEVERNDMHDITIMVYPFHPAYKAFWHEGEIKLPHYNDDNGFTHDVEMNTFKKLLKNVDLNTPYLEEESKK